VSGRLRVLAAAAAAAGALLSAPPAAAQDADSLHLAPMRAPASPAFVILGIAPASVERPATPQAFALGLVAAEGGSGLLPQNYAVEVAPYWMGPRRTLTWAQVERPGLAGAIAQSFTVSLATAASSGPQPSDSLTRVGIGFRVMPVAGQVSPEARQLATRLRQRLTARSARVVQQMRAEARDDTAGVAAIQAWLAADSAATADLGSQLADAMRARVGLIVEVAGALSAGFAGNDYNAGAVDGRGAWATVTYAMPDQPLDLIAVGRWLNRDPVGGPAQDALEVGGRGVLRAGQMAGSVEFVRRHSSALAAVPADGGGLASGNRLVGILEYRATPDLFVGFTFGQDHPVAGSDVTPLVARLGVNFAWGRRPLIAVPPAQVAGD
jgi:hypothetical protein